MSGLCKGDDFFKHMTGAALSFGVTGGTKASVYFTFC